MTSRVERILGRLGIEAKRQGKEWIALCPSPDHDDKNPSWRIRDDPGTKRDGYHKCWPCGFSGGATSLVSAVLGVTLKEARAWLAGDHVEEDRPVAGEVQLKVRTARGMKLPDGVVVAPLAEWVTPARSYAYARGLTDWQVERWGIGYATGGKLAGRIVIPYRDAGGRPRGYTARTFFNNPKRYLEAHPSEGAMRSAMFGEQHWPHVSRETSTVFVCEGALNALAVERALFDEAFPSVAAISGSEPSAGHVAKLATFGYVVVLTDPDKAGDRAAEILGNALARHCAIARVRLPDGKDASDLTREELRSQILA